MIDRLAPRLIWLNGAVNSGKTATAKAIQSLLPQTAHVEVDSLNAFINWMPLDDSIPIDLDNAVAVATVSFSRGLNVVVTYPLGATCHARVSRTTLPFRFFTLRPSLETCLQDRGQRQLSDWERQRVSFHHGGGIRLDIGEVIDNSSMTIAQCASKVLVLSA